jgi:hypothetical protein
MVYKAILELPYDRLKAYDHLLETTPNATDLMKEVNVLSFRAIAFPETDAKIYVELVIDPDTATRVDCSLFVNGEEAVTPESSYGSYWHDWEFQVGDDQYTLYVEPFGSRK